MEIKKELIKSAILGCLKKKDCNSAEIHKGIDVVINISEASLFAVLKGLESENLISFYHKRIGDRDHKVYQITSLGRIRIDQFITDYQMASEIYNYVRMC